MCFEQGLCSPRNIIYSLLSFIISFSAFLSYHSSGGDVLLSTSETVCSAEYDNEHVSDYALRAQDFSCLAGYVDIVAELASYQIINIKNKNNLLVPDVWNISFPQLKTKASLKNRKLLLVGYDFSRVQAAEDCYALKN